MTTANGNTTGINKASASLQELMSAKKAALEAQLRALDTIDIDQLLREREETAARLAELDSRITQVRVQLGVDNPQADNGDNSGRLASRSEGCRSRMSSEEVRSRILKILTADKSGLSQLQIAERTALAYGTVAAYLKANAVHFRTVGQLKGKRYFMK